jgi:cobaltochelatase CobT
MANDDANHLFLKSTAATMRALAGGVEHQVSYAGTDTHVGKEDVRLPALPPRTIQ